jgi:hypothetical protein
MLTDEELIEKVYRLSIELDKPAEITEWSTWREWMTSTHGLSYHAQMSYRITSFHNQVLNGGFIQYFDNRYGIFGYETLQDLVEIGARETWKLLSKAISIINPNNYSSETYFDFIYFQQYNDVWESLSEQLECLDNAYYEFKDLAEPIGLLAGYFRKHHS